MVSLPHTPSSADNNHLIGVRRCGSDVRLSARSKWSTAICRTTVSNIYMRQMALLIKNFGENSNERQRAVFTNLPPYLRLSIYIYGSVVPLPHRALHTHKYLQCDEFSLLRPFSSAISIRAYTKHMTAGIVEVNSGRWWFCESFKVNSSQSTSAFRSEGKFARHHKTRTKVHHRLFFRKGCIFCGAAASV